MTEHSNGTCKPMENPAALWIVVDDRERGSLVPSALQQIPDVILQFKRLAVGDYVVNGRCVFERKTVSDFAASVVDGRLFLQADKLARLSVPAVIILEGKSADLAQVQVRREALQGAMISLSLIFHLPVLRSLDSTETARLMVYAAQQIKRHEKAQNARYGGRPKRKRRLQLRILQCLPGIGPARAEQLLARFGTVEGVMTAGCESLEQVEGIGAKTAATIREVLQEAAGHYGNSPSPNLDL